MLAQKGFENEMSYKYNFCLVFIKEIHFFNNYCLDKRYRTPTMQSQMDNPEKKATQNEEKQNTICIGHLYAQASTYNVIKT